MPEERTSAPWLIHFFQRDRRDDPARSVPALEFLDGLAEPVAAEFHAVLDAVAAAPPPAFSGGGKWQAMHGNMSGFYEIRVQGSGMNHRLLCYLERRADDLGGPSIVCIDGLSKARRTAAKSGDYARVGRLGAEFKRRRTVLR